MCVKGSDEIHNLANCKTQYKILCFNCTYYKNVCVCLLAT